MNDKRAVRVSHDLLLGVDVILLLRFYNVHLKIQSIQTLTVAVFEKRSIKIRDKTGPDQNVWLQPENNLSLKLKQNLPTLFDFRNVRKVSSSKLAVESMTAEILQSKRKNGVNRNRVVSRPGPKVDKISN